MELKNGSQVIFPTHEEGKIVSIITIDEIKNYKILISKGGPSYHRGQVITKLAREFKKINHG